MTQPTLEDVYLELTGGEAGGRSERPRSRRSAPGPVHEQGVLAQPGVGVLHVRVPADVPRDLHVAVRRSGRSELRGYELDIDHVLRRRHRRVRRRSPPATRTSRSAIDVHPRQGDPEAAPGHAAAGLGVPGRAGSSTRWSSARSSWRSRSSFGALVYDSPIPTGGPLLEFIGDVPRRRRCRSRRSPWRSPAVIPNADAAPPIVNATILPLLFLSGIFIPLGDDAPMDHDGRRHLPGEALRGRDAGRLPRQHRGRGAARVRLRLGRRRDRRRVGTRWPGRWRPGSSAGSRAAKGLCYAPRFHGNEGVPPCGSGS